MVRNVVGPGHAPRGATAAMRFDAPPGTTITGLDVDARMTSNPGWHAGIHDATNARWLWCGARCWSSFDHWMHEELRGLATRRVQALVRCAARALPARRAPRARGDPQRARVPRRPVAPAARRRCGARWSRRPVGGCAAPATPRSTRPTTAASASRGSRSTGASCTTHARACDFTRRVPCSGATVGARLDTRAWSDGVHVLRFAARTRAATGRRSTASCGSTTRRRPSRRRCSRAVRDGARRGRGGCCCRCRAGRRRRSCARVCGSAGWARAARTSAPALRPSGRRAVAAVPVAAFDGPGEYAVRVALEDAAGNVGAYAPPLTLRFDDTRPGAPDLSAADAWRNGGALPLALGATGARPVSGIRGYRVLIGGRVAVVATSFPLDELPEGGTPVEVSAVSGAGLEGTAVRTLLRLDRTRPVGVCRGRARTAGRASRCGSRCAGATRPDCRACARSRGGSTAAPRSPPTATPPRSSSPRTAATRSSYRAIDGAGNVVRAARCGGQGRPDAAGDGRVRGARPGRPAARARRRRRPHVGRRRAGGSSCAAPAVRGARWTRSSRATGSSRVLDDAALPAGPYELRAVVRDVAGNETVGSAARTARRPL